MVQDAAFHMDNILFLKAYKRQYIGVESKSKSDGVPGRSGPVLRKNAKESSKSLLENSRNQIGYRDDGRRSV
jgi:hypothetical protein